MKLFDNTLVQALSQAVDAYKSCQLSGNTLWRDRWNAYMRHLIGLLPSGGGFDSGTRVRVEKCKPDLLVLAASFHHMNERGFYDGWTEHNIRVRPGFHGLNITITGSNKNDIKDYIHEVFLSALTEEAPAMRGVLQL